MLRNRSARLLLARALVHQPELLVLDEPTNGLDPQARHLLLTILRQLANGGTTLLLVTHQLEAVIPEVSRAVLMKQGRIEADGSVEELLQAEPLSRLFETPLQVVQQVNSFHGEFALKTGSGFGGCNAALMLQKKQVGA